MLPLEPYLPFDRYRSALALSCPLYLHLRYVIHTSPLCPFLSKFTFCFTQTSLLFYFTNRSILIGLFFSYSWRWRHLCYLLLFSLLLLLATVSYVYSFTSRPYLTPLALEFPTALVKHTKWDLPWSLPASGWRSRRFFRIGRVLAKVVQLLSTCCSMPDKRWRPETELPGFRSAQLKFKCLITRMSWAQFQIHQKSNFSQIII